jgi:hypothetical protein
MHVSDDPFVPLYLGSNIVSNLVDHKNSGQICEDVFGILTIRVLKPSLSPARDSRIYQTFHTDKVLYSLVSFIRLVFRGINPFFPQISSRP